MSPNVLFFLCLLYGIAQLGSTLKCHVCSTASPGEEDCVAIDAAVTKYLRDCPPGMNVSCRIQEQWVDFEVLRQKQDKRTVRQCASTPVDVARPCYYRAGFGGKTNVCNCLGDGCNSSAGLAAPMALAVGLLSLLVLKFIH